MQSSKELHVLFSLGVRWTDHSKGSHTTLSASLKVASVLKTEEVPTNVTSIQLYIGAPGRCRRFKCPQRLSIDRLATYGLQASLNEISCAVPPLQINQYILFRQGMRGHMDPNTFFIQTSGIRACNDLERRSFSLQGRLKHPFWLRVVRYRYNLWSYVVVAKIKGKRIIGSPIWGFNFRISHWVSIIIALFGEIK